MKKSPVAVILLAVLFLALPAPSPACGIAMTLWDLVQSADLVAVARVVRVDSDPTPFEPFPDGDDSHDVVVLDLLETWKGTDVGQIRVDVPSRLTMDPYVEGAVVLVFLKRGESVARDWRHAAAWQPSRDELEEIGLAEEDYDELIASRSKEQDSIRRFEEWSSGRWLELDEGRQLPKSDEDRAALEDVVRDAVRLQSAGEVTDAVRLDWFISVVAHRGLREGNLYGLQAAEPELSDRQLARIADILASTPAVDETDLALLQLLQRDPGSEVDVAAAAVIEAGLRMKPIPSWATDMVEEALLRYGDDFSARIGRDDRDSSGRLVYMDGTDETLPTIWAVARRDLGIPAVPPAEAPPRSRARGEE